MGIFDKRRGRARL